MASGELGIRPEVEKDDDIGYKEISDNFVIDVREKPARTIPSNYSSSTMIGKINNRGGKKTYSLILSKS